MIDEPTIATQLQQAHVYAQEGKYLHAAQLYRSLIRLAPEVQESWLALARMYIDQEQFSAAETVLEEAARTFENQEEFTFLLGKLYLLTGDLYRSHSSFRKLLATEKTLSPRLRVLLHHTLGLLYYEKGQWRLSEHYFRRTRALDPEFPHIQESIAELLLRREAVVEAVDILEQEVVVHPYSWIAHYLLGTARMRTGQWQQAYEAFTNAVDRNPDEAKAWQMCGDALLKLHQLDESERYLRKALELNPHCTDAIVGYGYLSIARGDHQGAAGWFERALKRDPRNKRALDGSRLVRNHLRQIHSS